MDKEGSPQRHREHGEGDLSSLTGRVIGAAIAVHRQLGPGLLESTYEQCLAFELDWNGIAYDRQVSLPLEYRGHVLENSCRLDFMVEHQLVVELKAVERLLPIHEAQVLTYLRLTGYHLALLINFNVSLLKNGVRRFIL
jgi:GxxExxY protein